MGSKEGQHMTVADLKPAAYNPRKIKEWELEALMGSPVNFKIIGNIVYAEPAEFMDISNAAREGIDYIVDTRQGNRELSDDELEHVAGGRGHFSVSSLASYMNSHAGKLSSQSQSMLRQSLNNRFGGFADSSSSTGTFNIL